MEWLCPAEKNRWSKEATPACLRIGPRVGRQGLRRLRELIFNDRFSRIRLPRRSAEDFSYFPVTVTFRSNTACPFSFFT